MDFAPDPQCQHDGPAYSRTGGAGSANRGVAKSSPSAGHRRTTEAPRAHRGLGYWGEAGRCDSSAAVLIGIRPPVPHPPQRQVEDRRLSRRAAQWAMAVGHGPCQGSSSVMDYSICLCILATRSGWNDVALQGEGFIQGLAEELKDELAAREESGDLEILINLAMRLDNRLWERCRWRLSECLVRSSGSLSWQRGPPAEKLTPVPVSTHEDVAGEPVQL
ncbi:uncharacterized protein [Takifugu rubripes]|uniref:uncharacterized protein n=1 Tax=Takifugu rubripes TaxID=31033 RepID=UPI001145E437|nr:uncharacterized protein LOC115247609 [Takifugu rubripes]XP_029685731.1 uncharacterized protein LOC115247609 [Takifugu rubripes]XP_029685732.1 uncharacterized protein LOC115247609 [Takifugu rubripes]